MSPRLALCALGPVALFTLACTGGGSDTGGDDAPIDATYTVDCIGMGLDTPLGGSRRVATRYSDRCVSLISDTTWGGDVTVVAGAGFDAGQNWIAMTIEYGGHTYVPYEGRVTMEWLEEGVYAAGDYDVLAIDENDRTVQLKGQMDWCDYGSSQMCPYSASTEGLDKGVSFSAPDNYGADASQTFANECRMVFHEELDAVQVDLQFGVFQGHNTAMAWLGCDMQAYNPAWFTFRARDIPGPGTYELLATPSAASDPYNDPLLNMDFELYVPTLYYGNSCFLTSYILKVFPSGYPGEETACTVTLEDGEPGRFTLDCADAEKYLQGYDMLPKTGDFSFEADCDARFVP